MCQRRARINEEKYFSPSAYKVPFNAEIDSHETTLPRN